MTATPDTVYQPTVCSHPGGHPGDCTNPPTMQYQQYGSNMSDVYAFFACASHTYPDGTPQSYGRHQPTCTLWPCNCTPWTPPAGINAHKAK